MFMPSGNIALCIGTHPKTKLFCMNLLDSLRHNAFDDMTRLPPIFIVVSDWQDYEDESALGYIGEVCRNSGGQMIRLPFAAWEAGSIDAMRREAPMRIDEFVFLQDTFEFLPHTFWNFWSSMEDSYGRTVWLSHNMQMYAAKFRMRVLDRMPRGPAPTSKRQAVQMEETWRDMYNSIEDNDRIEKLPGLDDSTEMVEKFGRTNMICRSPCLIKYKGSWSGNLQRRLQEIDEEGKV